jgi:DNA-binding response OmpR family regulator
MPGNDSYSGTILLVDDNCDIRTLAKRFLETAGWLVIAAADGEEGLRSFEDHRANIVLLLTDATMPKVNGFDLTDRVLGIDPGLPVLFMSGDTWNNYRGLECLSKPFLPGELVEKVSRTLNANSALKAAAPAA